MDELSTTVQTAAGGGHPAHPPTSETIMGTEQDGSPWPGLARAASDIPCPQPWAGLVRCDCHPKPPGVQLGSETPQSWGQH